MDDTPIRVCATADTLTLYWDKPARAPADCRYEVCAGGRIPVTVAHTHCTLTIFRHKMRMVRKLVYG